MYLSKLNFSLSAAASVLFSSAEENKTGVIKKKNIAMFFLGPPLSQREGVQTALKMGMLKLVDRSRLGRGEINSYKFESYYP